MKQKHKMSVFSASRCICRFLSSRKFHWVVFFKMTLECLSLNLHLKLLIINEKCHWKGWLSCLSVVWFSSHYEPRGHSFVHGWGVFWKNIMSLIINQKGRIPDLLIGIMLKCRVWVNLLFNSNNLRCIESRRFVFFLHFVGFTLSACTRVFLSTINSTALWLQGIH